MIAIASDHGGYALKEHIKAYLAAKGITARTSAVRRRTCLLYTSDAADE